MKTEKQSAKSWSRQGEQETCPNGRCLVNEYKRDGVNSVGHLLHRVPAEETMKLTVSNILLNYKIILFPRNWNVIICNLIVIDSWFVCRYLWLRPVPPRSSRSFRPSVRRCCPSSRAHRTNWAVWFLLVDLFIPVQCRRTFELRKCWNPLLRLNPHLPRNQSQGNCCPPPQRSLKGLGAYRIITKKITKLIPKAFNWSEVKSPQRISSLFWWVNFILNINSILVPLVST